MYNPNSTTIHMYLYKLYAHIFSYENPDSRIITFPFQMSCTVQYTVHKGHQDHKCKYCVRVQIIYYFFDGRSQSRPKNLIFVLFLEYLNLRNISLKEYNYFVKEPTKNNAKCKVSICDLTEFCLFQ